MLGNNRISLSMSDCFSFLQSSSCKARFPRHHQFSPSQLPLSIKHDAAYDSRGKNVLHVNLNRLLYKHTHHKELRPKEKKKLYRHKRYRKSSLVKLTSPNERNKEKNNLSRNFILFYILNDSTFGMNIRFFPLH